jgi:hypothetical protein
LAELQPAAANNKSPEKRSAIRNATSPRFHFDICDPSAASRAHSLDLARTSAPPRLRIAFCAIDALTSEATFYPRAVLRGQSTGTRAGAIA